MIDFARTSFSSYNTDALISTKKKSQGTRLKNLILSGELVPKELMKTPDDWKTSFKGHKLPSLRVPGGEGGQVTRSARPHEFHTQVSVLTDLPPPHSGKNKTHTRSRSDVSGMNKVSHCAEFSTLIGRGPSRLCSDWSGLDLGVAMPALWP